METSHRKVASDFFSAQEKDLIRQAVAEAEGKSSGEIATMVVHESDSYREAEQIGALLLAGLVSFIICLIIHHVTIWTYVPLLFLLFFPAFWLFRRFPRLKIPFTSRRRQAQAVHERAMAAFYQKGLYRTRDETGILIFISLLERKVWILGDRGINEKIQPGHWRKLAEELAAGIRDGKGGDALHRIVVACGDELARHFPRRPDDRNELPDEMLSS